MARYRRKLPPPDVNSARSWVGKAIRDAYENRPGLVHDVRETEEGIRLVVRFRDEAEDRLVALEPTADGHYLVPDDPKARYRTLTDQELAERRVTRQA